MRPLIILGAGGCGRDVAAMIADMNQEAPAWDLLGFLDDDARLQGRRVSGVPVLGSVDTARRYPEAFFSCCVADPLVRTSLVARVARLGVRWATLVHRGAVLLDGAAVGEGSVISAFCVLSTEVAVGRHVIIDKYASVGCLARVGDFVTFSPHATLSRRAAIAEGGFLGCGACVSPGAHVGAFTVVGGGAVVDRDLPPRTVAVGVPAHVVRERAASMGLGGASARATLGLCYETISANRSGWEGPG
jgi:sugar O-acyltransferase (sialic acid O-acetyltransferase NeuD family)